MKKGDRILCPHCGEHTIVKTRVLVENWQTSGEIPICMLCGGKLGDAVDGDAGSAPNAADSRRLSALLGEIPAAPPRLDAAGGESRFCRDCRHFIVHPFLSRCEKHRREADPMADCPQFERKQSR